MDKKKADDNNSYVIHPEYKNKFRPGPAREIIQRVLTDKLEKATYNMETTQALTKQVADEIKNRLKDQMKPRYKIIVQVAIGEQRGQGVRMGSRSFWDSDTDSYASETYQNEAFSASPPPTVCTSIEAPAPPAFVGVPAPGAGRLRPASRGRRADAQGGSTWQPGAVLRPGR
eukprot:CAMPEP_0170381090 /NCGR_PEP_ID=MMETSP0117_2-20130122/14223_1 /TAXON_ID=400756 /ORGANISM="Durinskia baltica, Strain CSIRO CS-38" /LENGTH=171 /DNA_ID=CAMNT_0010636637 /DNA_START=91 /DNA_END=604 /DNA_ORIENTATION=+